MSHLVFTSMSDVVRFYCQMKFMANCLFTKIIVMRIAHYFSCSSEVHVIEKNQGVNGSPSVILTSDVMSLSSSVTRHAP